MGKQVINSLKISIKTQLTRLVDSTPKIITQTYSLENLSEMKEEQVKYQASTWTIKSKEQMKRKEKEICLKSGKGLMHDCPKYRAYYPKKKGKELFFHKGNHSGGRQMKANLNTELFLGNPAEVYMLFLIFVWARSWSGWVYFWFCFFGLFRIVWSIFVMFLIWFINKIKNLTKKKKNSSLNDQLYLIYIEYKNNSRF